MVAKVSAISASSAWVGKEVGIDALMGVFVMVVIAMLLAMLVIAMLVVMVVIAMLIIVMVIVMILSKLERVNCAGRLKYGHTVGLGGLDDVEQSFLETGTVDDEHVGFTNRRHLFG